MTKPFLSLSLVPLVLCACLFEVRAAHQDGRYPDPPAGPPPAVEVLEADAADAAAMQPYVEQIPGVQAGLEMLPIPGGRFLLGSPESEADREDSEGPQVEVEVSPFWCAKYELSWDVYMVFQSSSDRMLRSQGAAEPAVQDAWADAVSRPTPPYVPMDFGWGTDGYPAICMTQFAAKQFTKWLSMKTGRFYRLPTEAEWEFACRAGSSTPYTFGEDPDDLEEHAWYFDNADDRYQKIGQLAANAFGLHDMHGNVAEWCLDAYDPDFYGTLEAGVRDPLNWPSSLYPRVVRGGSWNDDPEQLRSAARMGSKSGWKVQDPQFPKSIWYHTDASFVGMRVIRPLIAPPLEEQARYWEADLDEVSKIQNKQRSGER